jgi:hypothetical protein
MKKLILLTVFLLLMSPMKSYGTVTMWCGPLAALSGGSNSAPICTSYNYSEWSECNNNGIKTRTMLSGLPTGCSQCTAGSPTPVTSVSCTPSCTERVYSAWGECINGQQTRNIAQYNPVGCEGEPGDNPVLTQSCTSCTARIYSNWSDCVNGQQERLVLYKTPSGCVGEPASSVTLSRVCQAGGSTENSNSTNNTNVLENNNTTTPEVTSSVNTSYIEKEKSLAKNKSASLTNRLKGKILLQVESVGEAWYVNPTDGMKYYLQNGAVAYEALKKFGAGISNVDIAKIPIGVEKRFSDVDTDGDGLANQLEEGLKTDANKADTDGDGISDGKEVLENNTNPLGTGSLVYSNSLANRFKGRILLQVQSYGEAWYVNPDDGKRYYMKNGEAAYQIMRFLSLGINNDNLRKIGVGDL